MNLPNFQVAEVLQVGFVQNVFGKSLQFFNAILNYSAEFTQSGKGIGNDCPVNDLRFAHHQFHVSSNTDYFKGKIITKMIKFDPNRVKIVNIK